MISTSWYHVRVHRRSVVYVCWGGGGICDDVVAKGLGLRAFVGGGEAGGVCDAVASNMVMGLQINGMFKGL